MGIVKRCPTCGGMWGLQSEHTNVCQHCGRTLQHWSEIQDAPSFVQRYKDVGMYGI